MKKPIKVIIAGVVIILFILTIPGMWQNASDYKVLERDLSDIYEKIDTICDSGCKDYPPDLVIPGKELEAENYCLNQCRDKGEMKKEMREHALSSFEYRSEYHKRVGQLYCILGLNCFDNK